MMPSAAPEVPVRQRLEVERAWLAVTTHFLIVGGALPDRHAGVRQVRQVQQRLIALTIDRVELNAELLDLLRARRLAS